MATLDEVRKWGSAASSAVLLLVMAYMGHYIDQMHRHQELLMNEHAILKNQISNLLSSHGKDEGSLATNATLKEAGGRAATLQDDIQVVELEATLGQGAPREARPVPKVREPRVRGAPRPSKSSWMDFNGPALEQPALSGRRLVAQASVGTGATDGCYQGSTSTASYNLAAASCSSNNCPSCFVVPDTGLSADITYTFASCSTARWNAGTGTVARTGIWEYTFINLNPTYTLTVQDGAGTPNTWTIPPLRSATAYCYQSGSNRFYFLGTAFDSLTVVGDATLTGGFTINGDATVTGALRTDGNAIIGSGSSDTVTVNGVASFAEEATFTGGMKTGTGFPSGTTITAAGRMSQSGNMVVSDAVTFNGNVNLGNAASDTVAITGTATATPQITLSGGFVIGSGYAGTGATMTSTGDMSTQGNILIAETIQIDGNVILGSAPGDAVKLQGSLTATALANFNSGLNVGGGHPSGVSMAADGTVSLSGNLLVAGTTTLGDNSADTVSVVATSDVQAVAAFPAGLTVGNGYPTGGATMTSGGALSLTAGLQIDGHATLGDAATDSVVAAGLGQFGAKVTMTGGFDIGSGYFPGTGATMSAAGTMSTDGALQVDGHATLGASSADTVDIKGLFITREAATLSAGFHTGSGYPTHMTVTSAGTISTTGAISVDGDFRSTGNSFLGSAASDTVSVLGGMVVTPYATFTAGVHTGGGYSGTGATLSGAGELSMDASLRVGTTAQVDGHATLGSAATDTVYVLGLATLAQEATFASGLKVGAGFTNVPGTPAGITMTSTGDMSLDGNLEVDGADIKLGNNAGDAITITGVTTLANMATLASGLRIGSGYPTGGASMSAAGGLSITLDLTVDGNTVLGNNPSDKLTVGATGESTATHRFDKGLTTGPASEVSLGDGGNVNIAGWLQVTQATVLKGNVALGDGSGDTITIGTVAAPNRDSVILGGDLTAANNAIVDFSDSTANFYTTSGSVFYEDVHQAQCIAHPSIAAPTGVLEWRCDTR